MTTKETTGPFALSSPAPAGQSALWRRRLVVAGFGLIQWPWLLRSLRGGSKADKRRLLERLDLPDDALPNLGSWKADTVLLHHIVDTIELLRPKVVVELGAGATSLIAARALERNGGGHLVSFDQHEVFLEAMREWLAEYGLNVDFRHAPLEAGWVDWSPIWYALSGVPDEIDLLIIDGPPWATHPLVRGGAELLFPRIREGGTVLLDDANRPGERIVARRWRKNWPEFDFRLDPRGAKGTLIGQKRMAPTAP
ncbi:class I SAM-dependent methyltransferase [Croceicoccus ponticola]|uniref:Class I SAM-dependent methyltransferase n=1 Tax=Croceicoccus ponticola TaxID=2217664 RepID=A0A437GZ87_9SPHN|nr:class I SAM-dependent methyltransferase [Croceicoccus ponticola]RVQ68665.1 class I SAM-dependent methyltransferase [Croceicoccus ponticola]